MLTLLLLSSALADTLPPGEPLDNALAAHVTPQGLDTIGAALAGLVPPSYSEAELGGEYYCDEGDDNPLSFTIQGLNLTIDVRQVSLVPGDGDLTLDLGLVLYGDADQITVNGDCTSLLTGIEQNCDMEISEAESITLDAQLEISIFMLDDGVFDVTVDTLTVTVGDIPNPLDNCDLADLFDTLMLISPDILNNLVADQLDPLLEDLPAQLETSLEDALNGLQFDTSFVLGEAEMSLSLAPSDFVLDATGLFLGMGATLDTDPFSDCVDPGEGSELSSDGWPALGEVSWDGSTYHDLAIVLNKDFVDHLLWQVWASGLLCLELRDLAGTEISSDLLGTLYGEEFQALFPEAQPAALAVLARTCPTSRFEEDIPLWVDIEDLDLDAASVLDARWLRVCGLSMAGTIGLDLGLSSSELAPELIIEPDEFIFSETYSELLSPGYSDTVADVLPTIIGSFLPSDLLPTMEIPTFQGIGLGETDWIPDADGQWLGGFVTLDTSQVEPIEVTGCADSMGCGGEGDTGSGTPAGCDSGDLLGCDDSGCSGDSAGCEETGCSTAHPHLPRPLQRVILVLALGMAALLRRRR